MGNEVKENQEAKKDATTTVSISLEGIPREVHNKIAAYRNKITGKRNRTFTMKEAYVEFLKDHTK